MRRLLVANLVLMAALLVGFSFSAPGNDGWIAGEQLAPIHLNELDTKIDALESADTTLTNTFASYLPLAGGTVTGSIVVAAPGDITLTGGAALTADGSSDILATAMSATGQIDDNDLAAGAVDLDTGEVSGTLPVTKGGTGATALTNLITLSTHTTGNYVATIADSGASEVTVGGSGSEGAAVTLAIASTITRDSELSTISAASSTDNAIVRFDGTSGDVQDSLVTIADTTGTITTPGALSVGGSTGASTFTLRNMADSGWVECGVSGTTFTCATDADGTPDGTL